MVADFFPLIRKEGLVLPPDLALIFKALITMDGVLGAIRPGFDLSQALQRARGRLVTQRIAATHSPEKLAALLLEAARISDDAPRLLRVLTRRLEAEPPQPPAGLSDTALLTAAKWLAAAMLISGAMVAAGLVWG